MHEVFNYVKYALSRHLLRNAETDIIYAREGTARNVSSYDYVEILLKFNRAGKICSLGRFFARLACVRLEVAGKPSSLRSAMPQIFLVVHRQ